MRIGAGATSTTGDWWRCAVVGGPDTGREVVVTAGTLVVGRSTRVGLVLDDPVCAEAAAMLSLGTRGRWRCASLTGPEPAVGGTGVGEVTIGSSLVVLQPGHGPRPGQHVVRDVAPPGETAERRTLVRRPRPAAPAAPVRAPLDVADTAVRGAHEESPSIFAGPLVSGMVGFAGAVVTAVVFGQPAFVMAGVVGLMMAVAHTSVNRRAARLRRRADDDRRAAVAELVWSELAFADEHGAALARYSIGTLADRLAVIGAAEVGPAGLWERRRSHGDGFTVALGTGPRTWTPALDVTGAVAVEAMRRWHDTAPREPGPIGVELTAGTVLAVRGDAAGALARSIVLQLAVQCGPADWRLRAHLRRRSGWAWLAELPHSLEMHDAVPRTHDVWLVDEPMDLVDPQTGLRLALASGDPPAAVLLLDPADTTPAVCTHELVLDSSGRARLTTSATGVTVEFRYDGIGVATAVAAAAVLGRWRDPEHRAATHDLPSSVSLRDLLDQVAAVDPDAGRRESLRTPLGVGAAGVFWFDLVADGPHALLAGTTGSGKSELLRSLVVGLAARHRPEEVSFVLVDYKGGATFDGLAGLAHVAGLVTDLDGGLAERALRSLRAETTRRERLLRDAGAVDLVDARRRTGGDVAPRLVIVVDEFAALAHDAPGFLQSLVGVAQRGRSLGLHLVLATQRPGGVVSDDIRANTNARIALRLHDTADAVDVVGDQRPCGFPRDRPGLAMARLGASDIDVFQAACCDVEIDRLVGAGRTAAVWCPPLPERWSADDTVTGGGTGDEWAMGLVDHPDDQRQDTVRWCPDEHTLVVGSVGAGVSTLLRTVAFHAAAGGATAAGRDVLVIDAHGDEAWRGVAAATPAVVVVGVHERERLARLLRRAVSTGGSGAQRPMVLIVDGAGAVRRELAEPDRIDEAVLFDRLVLGASPAGVALVLGVDAPGAVPGGWVARCARRWVLRLNDPLDAVALGVAASTAPPPTAPPGRGVLVPGSHEVQWAHTAAAVVRHRAAGAAPCASVEVLAPLYPAELLPRSRCDVDAWHPVVGVGFDSLGPVAMDVPWGDHLTVLGPARSGRSATLAGFLHAWTTTDHLGAATWSVHASRRSPLAPWSTPLSDALDAVEMSAPATARHLLVVDDAEFVDDPDGRLAALLERGDGRVLAVIAARADGLRQRFGHWASLVRRSRLGVVMSDGADASGDFLGVSVPRRLPLRARPGLAVVADVHGERLVQIGWSPLRSGAPPA